MLPIETEMVEEVGTLVSTELSHLCHQTWLIRLIRLIQTRPNNNVYPGELTDFQINHPSKSVNNSKTQQKQTKKSLIPVNLTELTELTGSFQRISQGWFF